jgi:hypothetical protein
LVGLSVYASVGFITSNHVFARVVGITLPVIDARDATTAAFVGVIGAVLFLAAFVAYAFAATLPRTVEWWLDETVPDS